MDNRPIGVFDSGLGGLTAVKELERLLPNENIVYFGDTGRVPYGTKSKPTVIKYTKQIVAFLKQYDVKAVLAACGTVGSVAGEVGRTCGMPYYEVLSATAAAAERQTKSKRIGVIGTPTTIASEAYRGKLLKIDPTLEVFEHSCPLFVPLVENGYISPQDEIVKLVVERSLARLCEQEVDTLILGCTHYPIISEAIANVMGRSVKLINSGGEAAAALAGHLQEKGMLGDKKTKAEIRFFVTDSRESFFQVAEIFLGHSVNGKTEQVDIETY